MERKVKLTVNNDDYEIFVKPSMTLQDALREKLLLTGTKKGCNSGSCGGCTVLLNGKAVKSCLILALQVEGKRITTIEGLAANSENLHPIQEAFIEKGALQCGFCTPGMILSAKAFLDETPNPTEEEAKMAIAGNICRCTGYVKIVDAILSAAELLRK